MKLGVKLVATSVVLIGLVGAAFDHHLTEQAEASAAKDLEANLARLARAVNREAVMRGDWDGLADDQGKALDVHVTLVRADGAVLGDSMLDPPAFENQKTQPEIAAALSGQTGSSRRAGEMLVAVPGGGPIAAVRVARSDAVLDDAVSRARRLVWESAGLALLLAVVISTLAHRRLSHVVRDVAQTARKMREGDLAVRAHIAGTDELAELGDAIDALGDDISETLVALRAQRDLQARILEGMREGVLVLDEEDRVAMMNPAFRDMLLLGSDQQGRMFLEVARHAELQEVIERAHNQGSATAEIDIAGIKPRRLLVHASALEGGGGGLLAVCVDVTDVRRLESLRRDFVANVSHELRTPVAALKSATETLEGGAVRDPKAAERFLGIITRNAQRLEALIEDLLELSRLDARQYRLQNERVEIEPAIQIVLGLFRERAEQKRVRLTARVPKDVPTIDTDRRALEQVLGNLIDNAIKYCPADASVTVVCTPSPSSIRISVEDTGSGIEERHLARLFERFYRVDAGRSREIGGTGLGLSIVKHLTEALGGEVGVDSKVGKGSTFWIDLPRTVEPT